MQHSKLSKEKIHEMVTKAESGKPVEVLEFNLKAGSEKGDNYSGIVLSCDIKAKVEAKIKDYHWMIKLPQDVLSKATMGRVMHIEEKEIKMYSEIIPAFKRIIKERKADITLNFCDSPYTEFHQETEKGSILAMENLTYLGYKDAADKKKGLNIHYAKAALAEIAKFHALGYVYFKSYPGGIEEGLKANSLMARDYLISEPEKEIKEMFDTFIPGMLGSINDLLEAVQEPGLSGSFMAFHKERNSIEYRDMLYRPKEGEFNTFCHGGHMVQQYDVLTANGDEIPTKAALIDLAMTRWGNPCTDLAYFFYLSTTPQLRRTHMDELLGHYHDTLIRCFHQLGEDPAIYPYRQLLKDYDRYCYVGLYNSFMILPLILVKKEDAMGQDDLELSVDKDKMAKTMEAFGQMMRNAYRKESQIKVMVVGNFLEVVETGLFKL